jgi:hypothetical protein
LLNYDPAVFDSGLISRAGWQGSSGSSLLCWCCERNSKCVLEQKGEKGQWQDQIDGSFWGDWRPVSWVEAPQRR